MIMNKIPIQFFLILIGVLVGFSSCEKEGVPKEKPDTPSNRDSLDNELLEAPPTHTQLKLFDGGTEEYQSYRIPSLIRTATGTLIAYAAGRQGKNSDYGSIELAY